MRERIEAVGGQIEINSESGEGTQIMVYCEYMSAGVLREESWL